jgi:hypothetical protein
MIGLLLSLLILPGCGYHNPYTWNLDQSQSTRTIYLSVWENRTNEMGLDNLLFQKTADRLRQMRTIRITADAGQADYILSGTVLGVDYPATSFDTTNTATTLTAIIKVDYRMVERVSDKTVWQQTETIRGNSYPVLAIPTDPEYSTAALRSQSNKMAVMETIADEIGEHIYLRVTDTLITTGGSKQ